MLTKTPLLLIDGQQLYTPTDSPEWSYKDLEGDSARDEAGYMHRDIRRRRMMSCKLTYSVLTDEEYGSLVGLMDDKDTFDFTRPRPGGSGELITSTCYCEGYSVALYDPKRGRWRGFSFEIAEV